MNTVCLIALVVLVKLYYIGGKTNPHLPKLKGKVIVITGANSGIGLECVKQMAKLKPKVIVMGCRSEERASKAIENIENSECIEFIELDLSDLYSIK